MGWKTVLRRTNVASCFVVTFEMVRSFFHCYILPKHPLCNFRYVHVGRVLQMHSIVFLNGHGCHPIVCVYKSFDSSLAFAVQFRKK